MSGKLKGRMGRDKMMEGTDEWKFEEGRVRMS